MVADHRPVLEALTIVRRLAQQQAPAPQAGASMLHACTVGEAQAQRSSHRMLPSWTPAPPTVVDGGPSFVSRLEMLQETVDVVDGRRGREMVHATRAVEKEALKELISLRREVQHSKGKISGQRLREKRWAESAAYKREMEREIPNVKDVRRADSAAVLKLSLQLNQTMAQMEPDPNKRSWYKLFKHMDDDGSGKMTYHELRDMVRGELRLKKSELSEPALKAVWRALDADGSGYITAGEFGKFMRLGEQSLRAMQPLSAQGSAKARLEVARRAEASDFLAERQREKRAMADVTPASNKEVGALSLRLNRKLAALYPGQAASWYKLYLHGDADRSGKITFDEFKAMARGGLRLTPAELPAASLAAAWAALDSDRSGYITTGEFGAFFRRGEVELRALEPQPTWRERLTSTRRSEAAALQAALQKERRAMEGVQRADDAAVRAMSARLNLTMAEMEPDANKRTWYRLFKHMDSDGSGKITYDELEGVVRQQLRLCPSELSEEALQGVWAALDADGSGYITTGEFGHFMRLGEERIKAAHGTWKERLHSSRRFEAAEFLAERHRERRAMEGVAPADPAAVRKLSLQLHQTMAQMEPDPNKRSWYKLFKHMDDDGSGQMTYRELQDMVRGELRIAAGELPEASLRALWAALDEDRSGYITAGEFGHFMRLGEKAAAQGAWKERLHSSRRVEAAEFLAERHRERRAMEGVAPAEGADVGALSSKLNRKMRELFPVKETNPTWFRLFKHVDSDKSGKITYDELARLVRHVLRLGADEVPTPALKALWRSLDADGSGYLTVGEFGRFMKLGQAPASGTGSSAPLRRQASAAAFYHRHEEAMAIGAQLRRSGSTVAHYEAEMEQLRAELDEVRRAAAPPNALGSAALGRPATAPGGRALGLPPSFAGRKPFRTGSAPKERSGVYQLPEL